MSLTNKFNPLINEFNELLDVYNEHGKEVDKLCDIFRDAFDSPLIDCTWKMFDIAIDLLAEKYNINPDLLTELAIDGEVIFSENDQEYAITNIEELVEYLKG